MKDIDDWLDETYLKFTAQENTDPRRVHTTFYKGMFLLMFMRIFLVLST